MRNNLNVEYPILVGDIRDREHVRVVVDTLKMSSEGSTGVLLWTRSKFLDQLRKSGYFQSLK